MSAQEPKVQAKAKVQFVVEVDAGAPWGPDCAIGQLYKQAAESARNTLFNNLKQGAGNHLRIVGEPKILGIITEAAV